jgi:hypothetical protein
MNENAKKSRCLLHQILNVSFNTDFHRRVKQAGIETKGKNLTVHIMRKPCLQNWQIIPTSKQPTDSTVDEWMKYT